MDQAEKDEVIACLGARIVELEDLLADAKALLDEMESEFEAGNQAHQDDLQELRDYQRENSRIIAALQVIADGKGKYAKIAKQALQG